MSRNVPVCKAFASRKHRLSFSTASCSEDSLSRSIRHVGAAIMDPNSYRTTEKNSKTTTFLSSGSLEFLASCAGYNKFRRHWQFSSTQDQKDLTSIRILQAMVSRIPPVLGPPSPKGRKSQRSFLQECLRDLIFEHCPVTQPQ